MDREQSDNRQPVGGDNNQPVGKNSGNTDFVDFDAMLDQSDNAAIPGVGRQNPPKGQQAPPMATTTNPPAQQSRSRDWMPHIADDTDLIEKEWVDKAKEIVDKFADDPYKQNKELNRLKAEYLKKRYNKVIAPSD